LVLDVAEYTGRRGPLPERGGWIRDVLSGRYFLRLSNRRIRQCFAALSDNDDALTTTTADAVLGRY
jgi:hypothetical protein